MGIYILRVLAFGAPIYELQIIGNELADSEPTAESPNRTHPTAQSTLLLLLVRATTWGVNNFNRLSGALTRTRIQTVTIYTTSFFDSGPSRICCCEPYSTPLISLITLNPKAAHKETSLGRLRRSCAEDSAACRKRSSVQGLRGGFKG